MKAVNLASHRERLISQLNLEISIYARNNQSGKLPATATTLLNRIHRVTEKLNNRESVTLQTIIDKQDELAHRVFELNESSDELRDEINAVGYMLERRVDSYIVYEQQPNYIDYV